MGRILVVFVAACAFMPWPAHAQERVGDAALGAVSGALVLGPIGAVAGAAVGYAAGPSISRAWGLRSDPPPPRRASRGNAPRPQAGTARASQANAAATNGPQTTGSAPKSSARTDARRARVNMPPMQTLE